METAARLDRVEEHLADLAAAQSQLERAVADLAGRMAEFAAAQRELTTAQQRTEEQMRTLALWQTGETGRRDGERFERRSVARAVNLFAGGRGGVPGEHAVNELLSRLLPSHSPDHLIPAEADPTLADLIWWKGGRVAVVEISIVVDEHDVDRALGRAQTLQTIGTDAQPVVIGNVWRDLDTRVHADLRRVAWHVGGEMSE